jgi:hypothetical protein
MIQLALREKEKIITIISIRPPTKTMTIIREGGTEE